MTYLPYSTFLCADILFIQVGAGPTGLILALSLLKNGIPVRIVEKAPVHYSGIFRGSGISVFV